MTHPHIIFIMVDDMGWNDVSFHGSDQILTPNIDTLAYHGTVLQQYYTEPICTPSRAALLTGKYPIRIGMQGFPLYNCEDRGIPLNETLLPSYLKDIGYSTHLVGKWHVGMSRNEYLPLRRGFDSHFGLRGGFVDYYTYNKVEEWPNGRVMCGLDFFDGHTPVENRAEYLTDMLTDRAIEILRSHNTSRPLYLHLAHGAPHAGNPGGLVQPPGISLENKHVAYSDRRLYADIMTNLDRNIGRLIETLAETKMLENSVVIFLSDNGAPTIGQYNNWGINLPFRGIKQTPWEGGIKVPAVVWHSSLLSKQWNGLMHIVDWLPTILSIAGAPITGQKIDGIDQWHSIRNNQTLRNEVLLTIDDLAGFAAYRWRNFKIIVGNLTTRSNNYYGEQWMSVKSEPPSYTASIRSSAAIKAFEKIGRFLDNNEIVTLRGLNTVRQVDLIRDPYLCIPNGIRGCLYDIKRDPLEAHNLWDELPSVVDFMLTRLRELWNVRRPRVEPVLDGRAEPAVRRYTWLPWLPDGAPDAAAVQQFNMKVQREPTGSSSTIVKENIKPKAEPIPKFEKSTSYDSRCHVGFFCMISAISKTML